MKKKLLIVFLCISLFIPIFVFGDGSGNLDGGGGSTGSGGDKKNYWTAGDEGVRITIVDDKTQKPVSTSIDFTNRSINVKVHFGKVSKISYREGKALNIDSGKYNYINPKNKLPVIISSKTYGKSDIKKIKEYFCNDWTQRMIAKETNFDYEKMQNGEYKLLLEPVAYFTFNGNKMAMTATEAALYNKKLGGNKLRNKFASISHKNLPLAMFLEKDDLGFKAWKGISDTDKAKAKDDATIIKMLGIGIVYFNNEPTKDDEVTIPPVEPSTPEEKPSIDGKEYEYHTDTDVISSVKIKGSNRSPDNPVTVKFKIKNQTYNMNNIYLPEEGGEQYAWVKWHTPKTPEKIIIEVSSNATTDKAKIIANVVELEEKTPPDPTARDLATKDVIDIKTGKFEMPKLPKNEETKTLEWGKWDCNWKAVWVYYSDGDGGGEWVDEGYWVWKWIPYSATINATMNTVPDRLCPTEIKTKNGYEMKSGYGIETIVNSNVSYNAPEDSVTGGQNVIMKFPEFHYKKYNRILQRKMETDYKSSFIFKNNKYCPYKYPVHFTPLWYLNDLKYTTYATVTDSWTPAGKLSTNIFSDKITIKGNLYQDYHFGPVKSVE
ncbi:hypothetical protein [Clostridioides sp. ZZV15-6597]|uniref:hypothetical protein n=1 Tax=Clostridioides sp. ZZV15-6597 TaxID=2811500 RepID=UPI001D112A6D|nr:hypothetical protein [Clostridioides sp. ZZV15-6597]